MADDLIRYDVLAQDALRGVIRKVLGEVEKTGLPGEHHFFITFVTNAPGVRISSRLRETYPETMTIIIQHQYFDMKVSETGFEIGLYFAHTPERLLVPYSAIKGFYDPSASFELEFDVDLTVELAEEDDPAPVPVVETEGNVAALAPAGSGGSGKRETEEAEDGSSADVVSLDAFRNKT